jgi:hypothetical protein
MNTTTGSENTLDNTPKIRHTLMRGKDGKFMRNWRDKMVKQMAAQSRANIQAANQKDSGGQQ